MRKLLSRVVHFTLRSGQHVTCADRVSLYGRLSRTDFPAQRKTEPSLILRMHYKQRGWATCLFGWTGHQGLHRREGLLINVISEASWRVRQLLYG